MPDIALTAANATGLSAPPPHPVVPEIGAATPAPAMQPDTMTQGATRGVLDQYRDLGSLGLPTAASSDMTLSGAPVVRRDGHVIELSNYQQSGRIQVDEDTVTQQLGRGKTAEYSLSQLAEHSTDPEYFENTMRYAAKHGDSVKIDVHNDVASVTDPTLEHRLPRNFPASDAILRASVKHDLDPTVLAAVGEQESGMGKGASYNPVTHIGGDGHGHGMWQMDDRYHPIADCERAGRDTMYAADKAAEQLSTAIKLNGLKEGIQLYNGDLPGQPYYHLIARHITTIEQQVQRESQGLGR